MHRIAVARLVAILTVCVAGCQREAGQQASDLAIAAQTAKAAGKLPRAKELLDEAIQLHPIAHFYLERARIHAELGEIDAAIADCQRGLELEPDHSELVSLLQECRKPAKERFQGGTGLSDRAH